MRRAISYTDDLEQVRAAATMNRGGARPGAGRKPKPEGAMITRAFAITREQAEMIDAHAGEAGLNKSEWLRRLLDLYADDCD